MMRAARYMAMIDAAVPARALLGAAAAMIFGFSLSARVFPATTPLPQHAGGIWKAVVPPTHMKAQFDGFDPVGIAAGARIRADCSLNWIDPDDGERYCFASGTSLEYFLDRPHAMIARARARWRRMTPRRG